MKNQPSKLSLVLIGFIGGITLLAPSVANAAWDSNEVARIAKGMKDNSSINVTREVAISQVITLQANPLKYTIDLRIQDCFVSGYKLNSYSPYSCKKIKQGYPIIAELITWE